MAFSVKDDATDAAVRRLAKARGLNLTDTIREAVENEYARLRADIPLQKRLKPLVERYRSYPLTGAEADKAFFDELSGDA